APSAQLLHEAGVPYEATALSGDPVNAMLELIEISGCDMVVMGSRALGPIRRLIESASVSRRLIDASPVPVLLIKPPMDVDVDAP
ncbi:MAG: universal stress protein, partial [Burkholderiaceae bacterium]|nr:universal stress protein [Burkholderiaceae bacterium]